MATVLSPFSAGSFDQANLLAKMGEIYEQRGEQKVGEITNHYNARINALNLTNDRWETVRTGIQDARSIISSTTSKARSILTNLDNMIEAVKKAGKNGGGSLGTEAYAASFDAYLRGLDDTARKSTIQPNLIGTAKTRVDYRANIHGSTNTVNSAFLGSDYYIIDDEGKYWALNRTAKTLKRYDNYPEGATNTVGNFQTGIRLDDLSGDSITFTIGQNTANPQTFSGTLYRKGLDILDSWGYDGLASEDGRQRALDDLKTAKAAIELEVRRYEIAFTTSNFYERVADQEIGGLRKKTNAYMIEQATEIQKAQTKLAAEYQSATDRVTQSIAMQNQYAMLLNPLFSKSLVNIFA